MVWSYDVLAVGPTSDVLHVDAVLAPAASDTLGLDPSAAPFVRDAQYDDADGGWKALPRAGDAWRSPCHADSRGCRIRYSFALGDAAAQIADVDTAFEADGTLVAPPSTWLLRPAAAPRGTRVRIRVTTEGGARFATAMPSVPSDPSAFEADATLIERSSFALFGRFRLESIRSGYAVVNVAIPGAIGDASAAASRGRAGPPSVSPSKTRAPTSLGLSSLSPSDIVAWVARAVSGLTAYYGALPVSKVLVAVLPGHGSETEGETISEGGPAVVIRMAEGLTAQATRDDWVVTHELIHATLPSFGHAHAWLDEGIATYVEPIVRTRSGLVSVETFWRDLENGLPRGLPEIDDQGLERTHTWGRTYWGGALFCFLADVRIREATRGARSFDDAVRALAASPLDDSRKLDVARFLEIGDRATGTLVLTTLYRDMAFAPAAIDLSSLWARLGVRRTSAAGVSFDDAAPLAFVRSGITRPGYAGSD